MIGVPTCGAESYLLVSESRTSGLEEATITDLQAAVRSGAQSSVSIVHWHLRRIEKIDRHGPALRSVIQVNPDALTIAHALDRERRTHGPRGPMHGIPVLIKDNIDTHDRMMTTAGSMALFGSIAPALIRSWRKKLRARPAQSFWEKQI